MKKLIYVKTTIFICILLFMYVFKFVFGEENTLIGVTIIIATMMYLDRDLTANPWKNLMVLLAVNLSQGLFGYLSAMDMWLAIPLNLISMFIVGYFYSFNLLKPLTIAFGLQYLFILTTPVPYEALPVRLIALAFGAVVVMLAQWIVNRHKIEKRGDQLLAAICEQLLQKWGAILSQQSDPDLIPSIENSFKEIRRMVYHHTIDGYYVLYEGSLYLKISACLEKLHMQLDYMEEIDHKDEFINGLAAELRNVMRFMRKEPLVGEKLQYIRALEPSIHRIHAIELFNTFELMYELLEELQVTEKSELRKVEKLEDVPTPFRKSYSHIVNFNKNSVRFSYAVRLSIAVTIAAFISDYFALEQGKWILFTIFSVTQPYSEIAKYRFAERLKGTVMGVAIFFVLFSIFTDPTSHTLIILLFGYLNSFAVAYRTIILTATVPALSTAAVVSGMGVVTVERLLYVAVGIGLGMLCNLVIFPHSIEKGTNRLVRMYKDASSYLIQELYEYIKSPTHVHSIHHLYAISTLIEDRILMNNETRMLKDADSFLEDLRRVNHAIYELFLRMQRKKLNPEMVRTILEEVDKIKDSGEESLENLVAKLMHMHPKAHRNTINEAIVVKDVIAIYQRFKKIMEYRPELI